MIIFTMLLFITANGFCAPTNNNQFSVCSLHHEKLPCTIEVASKDSKVNKWAHIIQKDLLFTDQLNAKIDNIKNTNKDTIIIKLYRQKSLSADEHKLGVLLTIPGENKPLLKRSYTFDKKYYLQGLHAISGDILKLLTNSPGPFLYTLTYSKQIGPRKKIICIADYSGNQEKIVAECNGICTAPTWHTKHPVLLYSEFTKDRGILKGINLKSNKQSTLIAADGLCMQPSFAADGNSAVICSSQTGQSELYLYFIADKQGNRNILKQLTFNKANNSRPCFLPNGDVVFCSDFERHVPQIHYFDRKSRELRRLTSGKGLCAAPCYNPVNNSIVYVRYVDKQFQLFSLYLGHKHPIEHQLTFDAIDKQEPSWSPCGNYILYTSQDPSQKMYKKNRQIAVLNIHSKQTHLMTSGENDKSFPSWTAQTLYQS